MQKYFVNWDSLMLAGLFTGTKGGLSKSPLVAHTCPFSSPRRIAYALWRGEKGILHHSQQSFLLYVSVVFFAKG